jgi:hypothetical protein
MPGKKRIKSKSKKSMSDWDRMIAGVDESRLNARGRAALAQLRSGPIQVSANAVPRLSDIARAVASAISRPTPTSATRPPVLLPAEARGAAVANFANTMDKILQSAQPKKRRGTVVPKTPPPSSGPKVITLANGAMILSEPPPIRRKPSGKASISRRRATHRTR